MLDGLKRGITNCQMQGRGIVAVSGGGDSVALLQGLVRLKDEFGLSFSVAHLNHQLRGPESDADAMWVAELADRFKLGFDLEVAAIPDLARQQNGGIEETARKYRLDFLERMAIRHNATWIATGHHLQDQAETVLHHILRGTGLAGLRGIPERRRLQDDIYLVRPLLRISHDTIINTLADWGETYRTDSSNCSEAYTRNRIRHQLLPKLTQEYNPRVVESLGRLAGQAALWENYLSEVSTQLLEVALLEKTSDGYRIRRSIWLNHHLLVRQEGLKQLWINAEWPRQNMGAAHWERALETIQNGGKQEFPGGIRLEVRDDLIRLFQTRE